MLEKTLLILLTHKWIWIWIWVWFMQLLSAVRRGDFKWTVAISTMLATPIVGGVAFYLWKEAGIITWINVLWTIFISANAFYVFSKITDVNFVDEIINWFIKNRLNINVKDNDKK